MKKLFQVIFIAILVFSTPNFLFAEFYGVGVPIDPSYPADTFEGSGFASKSFTAAGGATITFSYNFISREVSAGGNDVNDWFGVALMDARDGSVLDVQQIGDVFGSTWTPINNWNPVIGPEGDVFFAQTGINSGSYVIPSAYHGSNVILGIGVFDLVDPVLPSALLIDNINLAGGDFETDPFDTSGYFGSSDSYAGPTGLFEWMATGSGPIGVDEPGSGSFAYISTFAGPLAPVPIPSTISLLGIGLLGLVGMSRTKKR